MKFAVTEVKPVKTLSSDKKIRLLASDALILTAVLILSYVESAVPVIGIPIPGFKLGLCNIGITLCVFRNSPVHGFGVSLARILIMFLLFGNSASMLFSLLGSFLALAVLTAMYMKNPGFSFLGISVICALFHNLGQLMAAFILVGKSVTSYLPFLIAASVLFGAVNGLILNLIPDKFFSKEISHE